MLVLLICIVLVPGNIFYIFGIILMLSVVVQYVHQQMRQGP